MAHSSEVEFPELAAHTLLISISRLQAVRQQIERFPLRSGWHVDIVCRYGRARPHTLEYPLLSPSENARERALKLNRYIQDGFVPSGEEAGFRSFYYASELFRAAAMEENPFLEVARSAVVIRRDQVFKDGNHRTSTLLCFEYMRMANYVLTVHPLLIYSVLSVADEMSFDQSVSILQRMLQRGGYKVAEGLPLVEYQRRKAGEVKELPVWATQVYQAESIFTNVKIPLNERRVFARWLKRYDSLLFRSWRIIRTRAYTVRDWIAR